MTKQQKGKHKKRKKSWHRASEDRRYRKAMKLMGKEKNGDEVLGPRYELAGKGKTQNEESQDNENGDS